MEVSMNSDFNTASVNKVSFDKMVVTEVEDGELVEDTNSIDITEEDKKELRAKRFGTNDNADNKLQDPKLQRLHKIMKVNNNTRVEALHLHGTDNMKTEDVFALFSGYIPASIEWITDKTCNAVWLDQESCVKALKHCSVRIKEDNSVESDESDEEFILKDDLRCALPPGGIWRRAHPTQLAPNLFMRFATYSDRREYKAVYNQGESLRKNNIVFLDEGDEVAKKFRPDTGNAWVDIAREWSYYEMRTAAKKQDDRLQVRDARELITGIGRGVPEVRSKRNSFDESIDEDLNSPRDKIMLGRKMQADIEEKKILSKKLRSQLNQSPTRIDLRQRLSRSRRRKDLIEDSSSKDEIFSDEPISYKRERRRKRHAEESWIRGDISEESEHEIDSNVQMKTDLRSKLRKYSDTDSEQIKNKTSTVRTMSTKKFVPDCPLQIEIDNDIYYKRNSQTNL